jgi:hypothetical protein
MKKIIGKIKNGGGDKGVDVNLPKMTNSGSTLVSVAPGFVSGSYTNLLITINSISRFP